MHQSRTAKAWQNLISTQNEIQKRTVQQYLVGGNGAQQQKLTSSKLIHFLRIGEETVSRDAVRSRLDTTDELLRLMQLQNIMAVSSVDLKVNAVCGAKTDEFLSEAEVSEPVLPEKNSSSDCTSSRWTIATNKELWDTVDLLNIHQSLPEPFPKKVLEFLRQDDREVHNPSSTSTCPSVDRSWALDGRRDPRTPTDAVEDRSDVDVKIPQFQIRKFVEIPVIVSHIVNPDNFFIQHEDTNLSEISEILFSRESSRSRSFAEMNRVPDVGVYVMAWFLKQKIWCRAQVCKTNEICRAASHEDFTKIEVEVMRIDYGDVACVSLGNIKELSRETALRPAQTLHVSLANVKPVNGDSWSFEASNWFKNKVKNKTLYARLYPERDGVLVELFMEKGKIGAMRRGDSLSVKLAQHGYAKHDHQRVKGLRSHVQQKTRQRSVEWEKYLISCYCKTRNNDNNEWMKDKQTRNGTCGLVKT